MKNLGDKSDTDQLDNNLVNKSLFISDLHLSANRPHITVAFLDFLNNIASKSDALYILGDLFEYWAGDDEILDVHHWPIITALKRLANTGVKLYFMHGNRDFLISNDFCDAAGVTLLEDPSIIILYGRTILLSHGDDFCTDDVEYQKFKLQVRDPEWQGDFLKLPLQVRKNKIETIRTRSDQEKSQKSIQIMDVNQASSIHLLKIYHYPELLIHGHTHRPNEHQIILDGHEMTRWVLGDWYEQGSYLSCDQTGCKAMHL